jgi:hypothetical protein
MDEQIAARFGIAIILVIFVALLLGIVFTEPSLSLSSSSESYNIDSTIPELQNEDRGVATTVSTEPSTPSQRTLSDDLSSTNEHTVENGTLRNKTRQNHTAQTTSVVVSLESAPNGLRKYAVRITTDTNATITAIEPSLIEGRFFQVATGGMNETFAELRGVDLIGTKGAFNDSKRLFTVTFDERVTQESINLSVSQLSNNNGEPISRDEVSYITINSNSVFTDPLGNNPTVPTDPDHDGLYEDIDGNKKLEIHDVTNLVLLSAESLNEKQTIAVDFNKNNKAGLVDAIYLFLELMNRKWF